jgi:hypothetical protein
LIIARYESETESEAALVSFKSGYIPDAGDANVFETENGKFVVCEQTDRHVIVVLDSESDEAAMNLLRAAVGRVKSPTD